MYASTMEEPLLLRYPVSLQCLSHHSLSSLSSLFLWRRAARQSQQVDCLPPIQALILIKLLWLAVIPPPRAVACSVKVYM